VTVQYDNVGTDCSGGEQRGLQELRSYVMGRWGGEDAGIYACRNIRGGSTRSTHSEGRAWDWQQLSRPKMLETIEWAITNADALNVQQIIDYQGRRIWITGQGWKAFTSFGAGWLPNWHIERNWKGANDSRPISAIVAPPAPPPPLYPPAPPYVRTKPQFVKEADMATIKYALVEMVDKGFGLYEGWWDPWPKKNLTPRVTGTTVHGPYPDADGWWPLTVGFDVRAQPRDGKVWLTGTIGTQKAATDEYDAQRRRNGRADPIYVHVSAIES
jgi:hypothetical protein